MPSVSDVFDELKKITSGIKKLHSDNETVNQRLSENRDELVSVNSRLDAISDILKDFVELQAQANAALLHMTRQSDTIICIQEKVSRNTCGMLTEAVKQTTISDETRDQIVMLADIQRSVHTDAALNFDRRQQAQKRIEACCPSREPAPACTYSPCDSPKPFEFPSGRPKEDHSPR